MSKMKGIQQKSNSQTNYKKWKETGEYEPQQGKKNKKQSQR